MYTFKLNLDPALHDGFVEKSPLCNLLQSSKWTEVKANWGCMRTGVYDGDTLVGCAQVLIKYLPLGLTMMYIPRGPVLDYTNEDLISFYMKSLRKWAKTKRCLFISFDPAIKARSFYLNNEEQEYDEAGMQSVEYFKKNNCVYKGLTKSIAETIQPRFHMGVESAEDFLTKFPKQTKQSINVAKRKGVEVAVYDSSYVGEFARLMAMTEERKNIHLRNEDYFKLLMDTYGDNAYLYLAKFNPQKRYDELIAEITKCHETNREGLPVKTVNKLDAQIKSLEKEIASMEEVLTHGTDECFIAGALMIGYGSEAEKLYAGMDKRYRSFRAQYLIYAQQFEFAFKHGYEYVNMGGVEGSLNDGLSIFKKNFNPLVVEYIGEFDLVVNKVLYRLAKLAEELRKKI